MNRGQLVDAVAKKIGLETVEGSDELAELQRWANAAVVEVLLETHCRLSYGTMALTADSAKYRTDNDILVVESAGIVGSQIGFEIVSLETLRDLKRVAAITTDPGGYLFLDGDYLEVWPAPTAGETLEFYYIARPTEMSDDSHDPSTGTYGGIATEYHRALEYYMLWQAAEYDDRQSKRSQEYLADFQRECALVRKRKNAKAGVRMTPPRIGYPDRYRAGRSNSQYPQPSR